jgi:NAD(P)-dependent dehydrogenase (short-subunit alcohol dehydrogenase family)
LIETQFPRTGHVLSKCTTGYLFGCAPSLGFSARTIARKAPIDADLRAAFLNIPMDMADQIAALAPAGRQGEPEELAAAIVFLASDDASFIHGVTIPVDGAES